MRAKISMIAVNMTAYLSVRKPALDAPQQVELEFASTSAWRHVEAALKPPVLAARERLPVVIHRRGTFLHESSSEAIEGQRLPGHGKELVAHTEETPKGQHGITDLAARHLCLGATHRTRSLLIVHPHNRSTSDRAP